jgi:uncharacterized coiled-coil protein SlyX
MGHFERLYSRGLILVACGLALGCASKQPELSAAPSQDSSAATEPRPLAVTRVDTVRVRDPEAEARANRLEIKVQEREAQIEDLQGRLDDARQEVVRAMAKLQTGATRAEAASGIAEAEVAVQTLKTTAGTQATPEHAQATRLLQQSSAEFTRENYGGALYLANQAKRLAGAGRERLTSPDGGSLRPGETPFSVAVKYQALKRANVRETPALTARVVFTAEVGSALTGYSSVDTWVRVTDSTGRSGWVASSLIGKPDDRGR